jgi:hypothetical protein
VQGNALPFGTVGFQLDNFGGQSAPIVRIERNQNVTGN